MSKSLDVDETVPADSSVQRMSGSLMKGWQYKAVYIYMWGEKSTTRWILVRNIHSWSLKKLLDEFCNYSVVFCSQVQQQNILNLLQLWFAPRTGFLSIEVAAEAQEQSTITNWQKSHDFSETKIKSLQIESSIGGHSIKLQYSIVTSSRRRQCFCFSQQWVFD